MVSNDGRTDSDRKQARIEKFALVEEDVPSDVRSAQKMEAVVVVIPLCLIVIKMNLMLRA